MNTKALSLLGAAAAIALCVAPAVAATSPISVASLKVTANVVPDCQINSKSGGFDFGKFDVQAGLTPKNSAPSYTIGFSCNNGTKWSISANGTDLSNSGVYNGTMTDLAGDQATYTITGDASSGGVSTSSSATPSSTLTAAMTSTDPKVGSYSDTVAITLSFQ